MSCKRKRQSGHGRSGDGLVGHLICGLLCLLLTAALLIDFWFMVDLFTLGSACMAGYRELMFAGIALIAFGTIVTMEFSWRSGGRTGLVCLVSGIAVVICTLLCSTLPKSAVIGASVCSTLAAVFCGLIMEVHSQQSASNDCHSIRNG